MLLSATSTITDVALSFILFSSTVQYVLYSYKFQLGLDKSVGVTMMCDKRENK